MTSLYLLVFFFYFTLILESWVNRGEKNSPFDQQACIDACVIEVKEVGIYPAIVDGNDVAAGMA